MRRSSFLIRVIGIGILLHVYVGFRLIPEWPLGAPAKAAAVAWLILSCALIPLGVLARHFVQRQPLADRLAWIGLLVPSLHVLYDYAWFVGFGVAFALHLTLMKVAAPKGEASSPAAA